jgi:hypothetical protein
MQQGFNIQNSANSVVITIEKSSVNAKFLEEISERLRVEVLAQQVDFDESIEKTGEEIKQNWWKKNGENFLKGVRR